MCWCSTGNDLRALWHRRLPVSLWLHLVGIEVLMNVHNAILHCRLKLVHEGVWHQRRCRVAASELSRVVACGAGRNIIVFNLLGTIIVHVRHLEAGFLAEVTHVAVGAEGEIVVAAALANPVTGTLIRSCFFLFFGRQRHRCETTFQRFPRSLGGIEAGLCQLDPFCG